MKIDISLSDTLEREEVLAIYRANSLSNVITTFQFRNLAMQSGIHTYERYFDASTNPDWHEKALNWVKHGLDPECEPHIEAPTSNV